MKRVTCFLLAILMLLGSTALADAPTVTHYLEKPQEVYLNKPVKIFSIKYNGTNYDWRIDRIEDGKTEPARVTKSNRTPVGATNVSTDTDVNWDYLYYGDYTRHDGGVQHQLVIGVDGNETPVADFYANWFVNYSYDYVSLNNWFEAEDGTLTEIPSQEPTQEQPATEEPAEEKPAEEINPVEEDEIEYEYIVVTPAPKKETYMHNNIRSFGPQVKEINAELTEKWFRITPVDLSEDGLQVFDMISGEYFVIGYVTVLVDGDTVTVERVYTQKDCWDWKENNYYTFFADLDSVYSVEPNEIKDEDRMEYKREYSIEKDLNGDTDVLLYMCNKATHTDDGKKLTPFRPKDPQNAEIIQAMADHILGLDIK